MRAAVLLIALSLLGACGDGPATDAGADAGLIDTSGTSDPVIAAALEEPIMVDPSLSSQANGDAIRPAAEPYAAPVAPDWVAARPDDKAEVLTKAPAPGPCPSCAKAADSDTLVELADAMGDAKPCGPMRYSATWAAKLPASLPLHPAAAVREAAGVDGPACAVRAVSFSAPVPIARLIDWYHTRTSRAGASPAHQSDGVQHLLIGKVQGAAAYRIIMTPHGANATDVDLIVRR